MHNHPTPKFSIITVTYNAEAVLEDTIPVSYTHLTLPTN